jgi:hypothetical protein
MVMFIARREDNNQSSYGAMPSTTTTHDEKQGNWGTTAAFSTSDFYRRGLVNVMNPIMPSVSLTRSVDVIGLMTIRRALSEGFTAFENMCDGCKNSSSSLSARVSDVTPRGSGSYSGSAVVAGTLKTPSVDTQQDLLVESNIPTIVKEFWQNTSVFKNYQPKTSFSAHANDPEAFPADVDVLASQLDEIEVRCMDY